MRLEFDKSRLKLDYTSFNLDLKAWFLGIKKDSLVLRSLSFIVVPLGLEPRTP